MIRAIMFDFGGVISSSPFEAFAHLEAACGLPTDFIRTVNATNPDANAWALLERGEVDLETFGSLWSAESRALGHELDGRLVLERLAGQIRPQMVAAIRRLRDGLQDGVLPRNKLTRRPKRFCRSRWPQSMRSSMRSSNLACWVYASQTLASTSSRARPSASSPTSASSSTTSA